jgi:hypothetical protein
VSCGLTEQREHGGLDSVLPALVDTPKCFYFNYDQRIIFSTKGVLLKLTKKTLNIYTT